jgi:hypothetical protein
MIESVHLIELLLDSTEGSAAVLAAAIFPRG